MRGGFFLAWTNPNHISLHPSTFCGKLLIMKGGYASMDHMHEGIRRAVRVSLAERDMTQSDLAEKIGVSPQYVSRIMQGQVGKIPEAWVRILDALELELTAVPTEDDKVAATSAATAATDAEPDSVV